MISDKKETKKFILIHYLGQPLLLTCQTNSFSEVSSRGKLECQPKGVPCNSVSQLGHDFKPKLSEHYLSKGTWIYRWKSPKGEPGRLHSFLVFLHGLNKHSNQRLFIKPENFRQSRIGKVNRASNQAEHVNSFMSTFWLRSKRSLHLITKPLLLNDSFQENDSSLNYQIIRWSIFVHRPCPLAVGVAKVADMQAHKHTTTAGQGSCVFLTAVNFKIRKTQTALFNHIALCFFTHTFSSTSLLIFDKLKILRARFVRKWQNVVVGLIFNIFCLFLGLIFNIGNQNKKQQWTEIWTLFNIFTNDAYSWKTRVVWKQKMGRM